MITYIDMMNRFWSTDEIQPLSGNETRLYFYLLNQANKRGWPEEFEHGDKKTLGDCGFSPVTLRNSRERLVQVGYMDYTDGGSGRGSQVKYRIRYQNLTPNPLFRYQERSQKMTPKQGVRGQKMTPLLTPNAGKVSAKVLEINTNSIYKRNKTFYSLTKKGVCEKVKSFLRVKKQHLKSKQKLRVPPPKFVSRRTDSFTLKSDSEKLNVPYTTWKTLYTIDGNEAYCRRLWLELDDTERLTALEHTPKYMRSADERWLKSPANYLEEKVFNNRIINRNGNATQNASTGNANRFGQGAQLGTGYRPQTVGRRPKTGNGDS